MVDRRSRALGMFIGVGLSTVSLAGDCDLADPLPDIQSSGLRVGLEVVAQGLQFPLIPTDLAFPGGDRILVAGIGGAVGLIDGAVTTIHDTTNADTEIIPTNFGMVAIELHPDFSLVGSPGYGLVYTITTERANAQVPDYGSGNSHQDVVSEWFIDPVTLIADGGSRREVLRVGQGAPDHNVSHLAFGSDGLMFVAVGDGQNHSPGANPSSQRAQDPTNIFGSILRIDPLGLSGAMSTNGAYAIPADNPYVGSSGLDEVYAIGVRSPYRLSVDGPTGDLYVGDVGQRTIEEINRVVAGGNYGWPEREGSFAYDRTTQTVCEVDIPVELYVAPIGEYDHDDGMSVVCGHVYRGDAIPALQGKMVFADFQGQGFGGNRRGRLFTLDTATGEILELGIDPAGAQLPRLIYTIAQGPDGALYVAGGATNGSSNVVVRIVAPESCGGDANLDGEVGLPDLNLVLGRFGQQGVLGDTNGDGAVDLADLNAVLANFGASCW